jgi:hypothetical protein
MIASWTTEVNVHPPSDKGRAKTNSTKDNERYREMLVLPEV